MSETEHTDPPENPVEEVVEAATETVVEPAETVVEEEAGVTTDRPPWVDEIVEAIHEISAPVVETAEAVHEEAPNPESPEVGHNEEIPDETPVRKPWTHRWFGS